MDEKQILDIAAKISAGQVGVLPTDTVYGIVASVKHPGAVEGIYSLTGRPGSKPFIILVSNFGQLEGLGISLSPKQEEVLGNLWPGPVSVILPCKGQGQEHLHRGGGSLAVRLPALEWLRELVEHTGPIVATSANLSGQPTPSTLKGVKSQLPNLDFYVEGPVQAQASKLVKVAEDGSLEWLER